MNENNNENDNKIKLLPNRQMKNQYKGAADREKMPFHYNHFGICNDFELACMGFYHCSKSMLLLRELF